MICKFRNSAELIGIFIQSDKFENYGRVARPRQHRVGDREDDEEDESKTIQVDKNVFSGQIQFFAS